MTCTRSGYIANDKSAIIAIIIIINFKDSSARIPISQITNYIKIMVTYSY